MKNWWLKLGCFLTGYNYSIMKSSSEASAKIVKKLTSAILIVSVVWAFIGYSFADRYLGLNVFWSLVAAIIMIVIVIQIERQIILNVENNNFSNISRFLIAVVMALIGSIIIDQIIFKEDIKIQQNLTINEKVKKVLPEKISEINIEVERIDSLISIKEKERLEIISDVTSTPKINLPDYSTKKTPGKYKKQVSDGAGGFRTIEVDTVYVSNEYTSKSIINPKGELIPQVDNQLKELALKRDAYNLNKLNIRVDVEKDLLSKVGFLDELITMKDLLAKEWVARVVWILWIIFFMFLELLVLFSKMGKQPKTDYDIAILHQRDVRIDAINELSKKNRV